MKNITLEEMNKDLTLPTVKIHWMGPYVRLYDETTNKDLAQITIDKNATVKIIAWCMKNSYRCPQIQNGKVIL